MVVRRVMTREIGESGGEERVMTREIGESGGEESDDEGDWREWW